MYNLSGIQESNHKYERINIDSIGIGSDKNEFITTSQSSQKKISISQLSTKESKILESLDNIDCFNKLKSQIWASYRS